MISHGKLKQVADQLRGYTFCRDCEQLLSKKGEQWVLANISDDQGSPFPLQDALIPEDPVFIGNGVRGFFSSLICHWSVDITFFRIRQFSSLTSNVVMLRMARGVPPETNRFW